MVTCLGIGAYEIGDYSLSGDSVEKAGRVLNTALDGGINFVNTGACYRNSEELIGLTVSSRRDGYVLATKCGHVRGGLPGEADPRCTRRAHTRRTRIRLRTPGGGHRHRRHAGPGSHGDQHRDDVEGGRRARRESE